MWSGWSRHTAVDVRGRRRPEAACGGGGGAARGESRRLATEAGHAIKRRELHGHIRLAAAWVLWRGGVASECDVERSGQ
eukprot:CAMPEP_0181242196 /NCGR_PEP_ID=MMETSP1096-20121128/41550_1 /TAXON_ID=156174 ORGANISM="Chrysochromulina ericina, Strain CCMP281" /NCGR_SAMPLE_ID=MMETSP1096 /ASSEMBLY_ACC=CAM_ASM_000453 /LENGTH=78 /DNA_ID=CAMNT_0023338367 /DNA_START=232 /DNA_END=465 /DNA_ORIENTATION=-